MELATPQRQYVIRQEERAAAVYDLSRYPANFNFVEFLVASATLGAKHVFLDDSKGYRPKYYVEETKQRMRTIVEPACELAGCTYEYGVGIGMDVGYHISAVLAANRVMPIKRLASVLPPMKERFTVTLRNQEKTPQRNSNTAAWREFAEEIGAFVFEDYADKPVHLHERMAYYAGAEMNYFCLSGPSTLCLFSDYPYTMFMSGVDRKYHVKHGWWREDLPWAKKNQHVAWCEDTPENIRNYKVAT